MHRQVLHHNGNNELTLAFHQSVVIYLVGQYKMLVTANKMQVSPLNHGVRAIDPVACHHAA